MDNRLCPKATPEEQSVQTPESSGPRWSKVSVMLRHRVAMRSPDIPLGENMPAMPHMSPPRCLS
jgi:hypothetical protein